MDELAKKPNRSAEVTIETIEGGDVSDYAELEVKPKHHREVTARRLAMMLVAMLSEHGYHFCRRFQFDAKPLRSGLWVVRFTVGTAALDGRTVADYYETGEVHHLADTILTKLENKPARSTRPVAVRVWHDQRQNGGTSARVYELHEPDRIVQNGRLSIEEQKRLVNRSTQP